MPRADKATELKNWIQPLKSYFYVLTFKGYTMPVCVLSEGETKAENHLKFTYPEIIKMELQHVALRTEIIL